jgi:DmsE family decaheme c-type cytochrome
MRLKSILAATGLLAAFAVLMSPSVLAQPVSVKPVCANCHESQWNAIDLSAHGAKTDANGSMCQACHGDATEHLKDPAKKPSKLAKDVPPAEKSAVCLNCHAGNRQLAFWEAGKHSKNDVSCGNCHNIHGKTKGLPVAPYTTTARPIEADTCGTCHKQVRNATLKPSHHPIIEGKVKCSDCHNPHGALTPVMLKHETVNQQCYSCHADKRGPFVFGHPPVDENCLSCHTPHGSAHDKLLNEKAPNLCQDCHVTGRHPTSFYGSNQSWNLPSGAVNSGVSTRFISTATTPSMDRTRPRIAGSS